MNPCVVISFVFNRQYFQNWPTILNYYTMYLKPRYLGLGSISNLPTYNIFLWNDVIKCLHVVDQSRKGKLMDALRKNIEENLCGRDINHTQFRKKKLCCYSKKIKAFWLLAQPKKMHFNRKSMQNQQKKKGPDYWLSFCTRRPMSSLVAFF